MNQKLILSIVCVALTGICFYQYTKIEFLEGALLAKNKQGASSVERIVADKNLNYKEKIEALEKKLSLANDEIKELGDIDDISSEYVTQSDSDGPLANSQIDKIQKTLKNKVKNKYSTLFDHLMLTDVDNQQLLQLLFEQESHNLEGNYYSLESPEDRRKYIDEQEKLQNDIDQKIKNIINNDEQYDLYQGFKRYSEDVAFTVSSFEHGMEPSNVTNLTKEQKSELTLSMVKLQAETYSQKNNYQNYRSPSENMSIDERVEYEVQAIVASNVFYNDQEEELSRNILNKAEDILLPEQFEEFKKRVEQRYALNDRDVRIIERQVRDRLERELNSTGNNN